MADFDQRYYQDVARNFTSNPTNSSTGRNEYSMSKDMSIVKGTELGSALLGMAKAGLIHQSFPSQGNIQPAHEGSQSNTPNKE